MKSGYLKIGEVAKLKGCTIKALRHYERVGVLVPAYVDPQTGYRYYSLRQLPEVDAIISCVDLGLPLREVKTCARDDGTLDMEVLLERGCKLADEKLAAAVRRRRLVYDYRAGVEAQRVGRGRDGVWRRELETFNMLIAPWEGARFDFRRYTALMTHLYADPPAQGLMPLYLAGMVWLPDAATDAAMGVGVATDANSPACADSDKPAPVGQSRDGGRMSASQPKGRWHVAVEVADARDNEVPANATLAAPAALASAAPSAMRARAAEISCDVFGVVGGEYDAERVEEASFVTCFEDVFAQVAARPAPCAVLVFEVWDAQLSSDRFAVEKICLPASAILR